MKNISVFVSSTFNDMQSERDLIRESIAPELQDVVRRYGCNLDFVDLRWGINTKDMSETEANRKILQTCFDEIHSSKPFFVAFIAERYGWVPDSDDVRQAFSNDAQDVSPEDLNKSITELEIDCALKSFPDPEHCLFFFRKPIDYGADSDAERSFVSRGADKRKLELLKERIRRLYPNNVAEYGGVWNERTQRVEGLEELEPLLCTRVGKALNDVLLGNAPASPTEECVNYTDGLINSLNSTFAGRDRELGLVREFLQGEGRLATLVGDSGSGKSALMARVATLAKEEGYAVLPFFAGCHLRAQSAEDLMETIAHCACSRFGATNSGADLAARYYNAVNSLAMQRKTLLVVDAVNQLTPSASEELLVWLNMFALHHGAKVLLSATSDYNKLRQLAARNSLFIDVDAFCDEDVANVAAKFFASNHRQVNNALLNAIVCKPGNACNSPVFLVTLLTELNNIGKEDFAAIHRRERELGETPIDAIFNYLVSRVEAAPAQLGPLLEDFLRTVTHRLGEVCYVFTAAIAGSRRGIGERLIERVCNALGIPFRTADFSYYRKLLGGHIVQRENGAWDNSHLLVKQLLRRCVPQELMRRVTEQIVRCLEEEDSAFKQTEYAYYLRLTGKLAQFAPYYTAHCNDTVTASLVGEISEDVGLTETAHLFDDDACLLPMCSFVSATIAAHRYSPATAEELARLALNAIYRTEDHQHNPEMLAAVADIYSALGKAAMFSGYTSAARDYLHMAVALNGKLHRECAEQLRLLAELGRKTGNIVAEARCRSLYKKHLQRSGNNEQLFELLYKQAMHCTELSSHKRRAKALLGQMRALLPQEDNALHCAKLLVVCARAGLNAQPAEIAACERFVAHRADDFNKALVLYTLAYACPEQAAERAEEAYRIVKALLTTCADMETLTLAADIAELLCALHAGTPRAKQLSKERPDFIAQLNALRADYGTLTEYMRCAPKGTAAYINARKQYHAAARGQVKREYLVADKFIALVAICMCAVFLVALPIFFAALNGINYLFDAVNLSPMSMYVHDYIYSAFEAFYTAAFCFGMYGLLQVIRPQTDYASRRRWSVRCALFFAAAAAILALFAVVYTRLSAELFDDPPFAKQELPTMALLSAELALLMLAVQEALSLCMRELPLHPVVRSHRRFVAEFPARAWELSIHLLLVAVLTGAYMLLCGSGAIAMGEAHITAWTSNMMMVLPQGVLAICAAALALFILVRLLRLTVLYLRLRGKEVTANEQ